jgi:hypothetical protein
MYCVIRFYKPNGDQISNFPGDDDTIAHTMMHLTATGNMPPIVVGKIKDNRQWRLNFLDGSNGFTWEETEIHDITKLVNVDV